MPFDAERRSDNEARMPTESRAHRAQHRCDEPRPAASAGRQQSDDGCPCPQPVDNYVDSSSSFVWWSRTGREGYPSLTADPDPPFVAVWNTVVAELNGDTETTAAVNGDSPPPPSHPSKGPG